MSPQTLSARYEIAEQTLAKWRHEGTGPAYFVLGNGPRGRVRYWESDVLDWFASNTTETVA